MAATVELVLYNYLVIFNPNFFDVEGDSPVAIKLFHQ